MNRFAAVALPVTVILAGCGAIAYDDDDEDAQDEGRMQVVDGVPPGEVDVATADVEAVAESEEVDAVAVEVDVEAEAAEAAEYMDSTAEHVVDTADLPPCPAVGDLYLGGATWRCWDYPAVENRYCQSALACCTAEECAGCGACPNVKLMWRPGGVPVEDPLLCVPCAATWGSFPW